MNDKVTGGYIDFSKLSDEEIIRYESCFICGNCIEIKFKPKRAISYKERLKLMFVSGEILLCNECTNKINNINYTK